MKVKESLATYKTMPSTAVMRGRLLEAIENEENSNFIQDLYVTMLRMKEYAQTKRSVRYSLSDLKGVLALDNKMSYAEMREEYLAEKYPL